MKIKFFSKVKKAVFSIENYQDFSIEKLKNPIFYVLKLMLIFTIIITISITYKTYIVLNEIYKELTNDKTNFYFENNKLVSDEGYKTFSDDSNILSVIINTTDEKIDKNESVFYIIANADSLKVEYSGTSIFNLTYEEIANYYNLNEISKDTIISYYKTNNIGLYLSTIFLTGVIIYIEFTAQLLFRSLMLAILGYIITKITIIKFKFKPIWNMSIYALTLSTILYLIYIVINIFTGFTIKYFSYAYDAISYIYLITAILMIKSALIKQQIELSKIIEEQKKVQEEHKEEEKVTKPDEEKKKKDKEQKNDPEQEPKANEV